MSCPTHSRLTEKQVLCQDPETVTIVEKKGH